MDVDMLMELFLKWTCIIKEYRGHVCSEKAQMQFKLYRLSTWYFRDWFPFMARQVQLLSKVYLHPRQPVLSQSVADLNILDWTPLSIFYSSIIPLECIHSLEIPSSTHCHRFWISCTTLNFNTFLLTPVQLKTRLSYSVQMRMIWLG